MNEINEIFDRVFVINLKRRPDRLEHFRLQAEKYGIFYEVIEAFDGETINGETELLGKKITPSGEYKGLDGYMKSCLGATMSHYSILKKSIDYGYKKILIFEDDVLLSELFDESLLESIELLPDNWDCFYLSGTMINSQIINHRISKLISCFCLHSYCLTNNVFEKMKKEIEEKIFYFPVDVIFSQNLSSFNSYVSTTILTHQYPNYSDIQKTNVKYF